VQSARLVDRIVELLSLVHKSRDSMKTTLQAILPVIALLVFGYQASAQLDLRIMLDPSVLKFFDQKSAFSANAEVITEVDGKPDVMPVKIAILGNLTRVEMDITQERGGKAGDEVMAEVMAGYRKDMKTAGSAESVSIFNPDKKCTFLILPRLKAYLQTPILEKEMAEIKQRPKAEKIELGKDKIDGHACTKYTLKFAVGHMDIWRTWESPSATVWIAQDVPACPLRMDLIGGGRTNSTFLIKDVEATKVDKKMFEPPKGFNKCETEDALIKIIMEHWPKDKTQ